MGRKRSRVTEEMLAEPMYTPSSAEMLPACTPGN